MTSISTRKLLGSGLRTVAAVAASAAVLGASAATLPSFTFDPSAVGLNGTAFTADNLIISNFATVTATATGFQETGFLSITSAQLGGGNAAAPGLNSTYGLYIAFEATGVNEFATPSGFYGGAITDLSYTFYGYNGTGTFSPTSAPAGTVTLGTGTLESGSFQGTRNASGVTAAYADLSLNFTPNAAAGAFFASPQPFFLSALASFANHSSEIVNTPTGFTVSNGGGSINFVTTPVPEPETYAMLLAGLGLIGGVAVRRRSKGQAS